MTRRSCSTSPPPVTQARLRHEEGEAMRPRLDRPSPTAPRCNGRSSRWTHRVGVTGRTRDSTPTRNAIGLSSPVGVRSTSRWRAKPWRSVLPLQGRRIARGGAVKRAADMSFPICCPRSPRGCRICADGWSPMPCWRTSPGFASAGRRRCCSRRPMRPISPISSAGFRRTIRSSSSGSAPTCWCATAACRAWSSAWGAASRRLPSSRDIGFASARPCPTSSLRGRRPTRASRASPSTAACRDRSAERCA